MQLPVVAHRPVGEVDDASQRYLRGERFNNLGPQPLTAVPDLFTPEVWVDTSQRMTADSTMPRVVSGNFEGVMDGAWQAPEPVVRVARSIVELERHIAPHIPDHARRLDWFPRIDIANYGGIPHIDVGYSSTNQLEPTQAFYSAANIHGTVGYWGETWVPFGGQVSLPVDASAQTMERANRIRGQLVLNPSLVIVPGSGNFSRPTEAGYLHRFEGLHNFPSPELEISPNEPRLFHAFRVRPMTTNT